MQGLKNILPPSFLKEANRRYVPLKQGHKLRGTKKKKKKIWNLGTSGTSVSNMERDAGNTQDDS